MDLTGKAILITGGATGIGRAAALEMAAGGATVVVADLNEVDGRKTVDEIERAGGRARFLLCDVTSEAAVRSTVDAALAWAGKLNVVVTAAGILQGAFLSIEALETATLERVMNVNFLGTFLMCKYAAPVMEASGGGVILCIASGAGVRGPSSSLAYGASKAAVQGLCYTLERQLAPRGIRLNVVCPGSVDTPLKRQNVRDGATSRGQDPEQAVATAGLVDPRGVARILRFAASDAAAYLLGTLFTR
ncbi:MAG: SDR family oxidoreductase [Armatimonadetes bacterium]|nr:SDR family oxidoreductase [Armatimonadota bacterium]